MLITEETFRRELDSLLRLISNEKNGSVKQRLRYNFLKKTTKMNEIVSEYLDKFNKTT